MIIKLRPKTDIVAIKFTGSNFDEIVEFWAKYGISGYNNLNYDPLDKTIEVFISNFGWYPLSEDEYIIIQGSNVDVITEFYIKEYYDEVK